MKWVDGTSRMRGEQRQEPQTWLAEAGPIKLVVTRHIYNNDPTDWRIIVGDMRPVVIVGNQSADAAKQKCIELAREYAQSIIDALDDEES